MTTHYLKTHPEPFQAVWDGLKPWEFRKNDRNFQVGDTLVLQEWKPGGEPEDLLPYGQYTGREIPVQVTFILKGPAFGIPEGYCIMSIRPVPVDKDTTLQDVKDTIGTAHALTKTAIGYAVDLDFLAVQKPLWKAVEYLSKALGIVHEKMQAEKEAGKP